MGEEKQCPSTKGSAASMHRMGGERKEKKELVTHH